MVRTMSLLRALLSTARTDRPAQPLSAGLPPDDAVLLDAPDTRLAPVLVAAALGGYEPASCLLAATRETAEWENRDRYVVRLAAFARSRGDWLVHWLRDAPDDPDALLVGAELAVLGAWESPARSERLAETGPLIDAATAGDPRDPVPWRVALDRARGLGATHTTFEALWEQAIRRAPHHYGCHLAALRYVAAHGRGSHRECFDFAERAAEDALPGSLVQALPLRAAFSQLMSGEGDAASACRIDRAADLAIAVSGRSPAGDPCPAELRNLLAYVLARRARWTEALEQFRLIGACATSFPWTRFGDDALGRFLETREVVRIRAASSPVLRSRAGEQGRRDHYA